MSKPVLHKFVSRNQITDRWLRENPNAKIECWFCGKTMENANLRQKYCSKSCQNKYFYRQHKVPLEPRPCLWCNGVFERKRRDNIFCSNRCRLSAQRQRNGVPQLGNFKRDCKWCGMPFTVKWSPQKYCSYEHFEKYWSRRKTRLADNDLNDWNRMREKFWFGIE